MMRFEILEWHGTEITNGKTDCGLEYIICGLELTILTDHMIQRNELLYGGGILEFAWQVDSMQIA